MCVCVGMTIPKLSALSCRSSLLLYLSKSQPPSIPFSIFLRNSRTPYSSLGVPPAFLPFLYSSNLGGYLKHHPNTHIIIHEAKYIPSRISRNITNKKVYTMENNIIPPYDCGLLITSLNGHRIALQMHYHQIS